jgi:HlyD family secretion protein
LTAQTNLTTIQTRLAKLQANNGIDPDELALAQAALNNAQAKLAQSQANLVNATLTAPFDGLVTAMNAKVGQLTGKTSIMTIAATTSPRVIASFDETDLNGLALNCPAEVTFSSNESKTYTGTVTQILPQMVNSSVKASVSLGADAQKVTLGSSASVLVTCQQAKGALVITSQALHVASDGSYFVYVPGTAGEPVKRTVTVGLQTTALAQITDGLTAGEAVIVSGVNE